MHILENCLLMYSADLKHRGLMRDADTVAAIAAASGDYALTLTVEEQRIGPEPLDQLNRELTDSYWRRWLVSEIFTFIKQRRRATCEQLKVHFAALECPEPDEYPPPDMARLQRALATLVRHGKIQRVGHALYEYVRPMRRGGIPNDAEH